LTRAASVRYSGIFHKVGIGWAAFFFQTGVSVIENVRLTIDKARQDRGAGEVDHRGLGRDRHSPRGSDLDDPIAAHEDDLIRHQPAGSRVEHLAGPDGNDARALRRQPRSRDAQHQKQSQPRFLAHAQHHSLTPA